MSTVTNTSDTALTVDHVRDIVSALDKTATHTPMIENDYLVTVPREWYDILSPDQSLYVMTPRAPGSRRMSIKPRRAPDPARIAARKAARKARRITRRCA